MSDLSITSHADELYELYSIQSNQFFVKLQKLYNIACKAFWGGQLDKFKNSDGSIREYDALNAAFNSIDLENRLIRNFRSNWRTANEIKHGDSDIEFERNYAHLCAENYNKIVKVLFEDIPSQNIYSLEINKLSLKDCGQSAFELAFSEAINEKLNVLNELREAHPDIKQEDDEAVANLYGSARLKELSLSSSRVDPDIILCPICNGIMTIKTNRRDGSQFWGCSRFPACRGTRKYGEPTQKSATIDEPIWFISRARAAKAKVEFVQSLGIVPSLLDHILLDDKLFQDVKRYSHWRFDFIPSKLVADDAVQYICNLAYKILTRGRITTVSPYVEMQLKTTFGDSFFEPNSFEFLISYLSECKNGIAYLHDGYGTEKQFYEEMVPRLGGRNFFNYIIPQADIATLIESDSDFGNQRVDFAINDGLQKLVIELDDHQHEKHREYDQYRDKVLRDHGYQIIRIPNAEVRSGVGPHIDELNQALAPYRETPEIPLSSEMKSHIASKVIHQAQIVTISALLRAACSNTSRIHLDLNSTFFSKEEIKNICDIASNDLNLLLNNISKLCLFSNEIFNLEFTNEGTPWNFEITYQQSEQPTVKRYVITDMLYAHDIVNNIPHYTNPFKYSTDKKLLEYFLNYIFRKPSFREGQHQALSNVLAGIDSIVLLPTGAGKSIAFQLACFLMPGIAFVVSPLISLMEDQVDNLRRYGIDRVAALSGSMEGDKKKELVDLITMGDIYITYISPERLQIDSFRSAISKTIEDIPIPLFVIDEAHCLSEWGHDFRTAYLNLGRIIRDCCKFDNKSPTIIALTGTASDNVLKDIRTQLDIWRDDSLVVPVSFDRKELHYRIVMCDSSNKLHALQSQLKFLPNSFDVKPEDFYSLNGVETYCGIIFCPHVNSDFGVMEIYNRLKSQYNCNLYSGKKPKIWTQRVPWEDRKRKTSKDFKDNRFNLLIATTAYGMGIDKANIRYIIHYNMPQSIESFYQETGRAGRNGDDAECIMIASLEGNMGHLLEGSSLEQLKVQDEQCVYDDVRRVFFFHRKSFQGIESELKNVEYVLEKLQPDKIAEINCSFQELQENFKDSGDDDVSSYIEKAIYRLLLIGVISDYTKIRKLEYKISLRGATKESISKAYGYFVAKYNSSRVKSETVAIAQYNQLSLSEYIMEVSRRLLQFMYDNIERGRAFAIQSIYDLVNRAIESEDQDSTIRSGIINYLKTSEQNSISEIINANDGGFESIRTLFETTYINEERTIAFRAQISRALESTPDHPGLLLSRALIDMSAYEARSYDDAINEANNAVNYARNRYSIKEETIANFMIWFLKRIYDKGGFARYTDICIRMSDVLNTDAMLQAINIEQGESELMVPFAYMHFNMIATTVLINLNSMEGSNGK